jgi:hypothetical protein
MMAAVLVVGVISMVIPASFAQPYYQQYDDPYAKDHKKKSTDVNIQKIKCVNSNVNVNGIEITQIPQNGEMTEAQALEDGAANGNGPLGNGLNIDKNLVNICVNVNVNEQAAEDGDDQADNCQSCIEETLTEEQINNINSVLMNGRITFQVGTEEPQTVTSLTQVCEIITNANGQVTPENIRSFFEAVNEALIGSQLPPIPPDSDTVTLLIDCLQAAGLVTTTSG